MNRMLRVVCECLAGSLNDLRSAVFSKNRLPGTCLLLFPATVFFLTPICGTAQDPHPCFRHYTVENGLPDPDVYQVIQDSKGYIWFATSYGVSRFDGYEFKNFTTHDGLPDNTVFDLYEDKSGRIWFIPLSCRLSYYDNGRIYPYAYNEALSKRLSTPIKTSFCVDENQTVFLGVLNDGIYQVSKEGDIRHYPSLWAWKSTLRVLEPEPGRFVYAFSSSSLLQSFTFSARFFNGTVTLREECSAGTNIRMLLTKDNTLLVSNIQHLFIIQKDGTYSHVTFPQRIHSLYEDQDGDIWIGTFLGGVYHVKAMDFERMKNYLPGISINGICQDHEKGFWFASEGNEVFYTPSKQVLVYDEATTLPDEQVNCLLNIKGTVCAGTRKGMITMISPQKKITSIDINKGNEHANNVVRLFYDEARDELWISGNACNGRIKNGRFTHDISIGYFYDVLKKDEQHYWISSTTGIWLIEKNAVSGRRNLYSFAKRISSIVRRGEDTLWLGALNGLWEFHEKDSSCIYLGGQNKLLGNRVQDMEMLAGRLLVMATKGAGIILYDGRHAVQVDHTHGLSDDNVHRLYIDGNTIWAATSMGVNKIELDTVHNDLKISAYTAADGLASNQVHDITKAGNELWIASGNGISVMEPQTFLRTSPELPVYIEQVQVNGAVIGIYPVTALGHNQNNIKIKFLALGYKNAGHLEYRYKMAGLDTHWVYTRNREIQFTTLPAGTYTFEVEVRKSDGQWGHKTASLVFIVHAPFWKKWWFSVMLGALVAAILYLVFRFRFRKKQRLIKKEEEINRNLLELRLKALRAQMNPHFTFNVMNSVQHYMLHNQKEAANKYMSMFSRLIRLILNNSEQNTIPLSEELKALELYIQLEKIRFEEGFDYTIFVSPEINPDMIQIPSMLIQPYVENAIKHGILPSGKKGTLKVEITLDQHILKCVIEDDGIGRKYSAELNRQAEYTSLGTHITQERLEAINSLHKANLSEKIIDLFDAQGNAAGTRVEIYIAMNQSNGYESDHR